MLPVLNNVKVSEFISFLPTLIKHFTDQIASFQAGRIAKFYAEWQKITSDPEILDMVRGTHIEFSTIPAQFRVPQQSSKFTQVEVTVIEAEISSLLSKGVIVHTNHEPNEFISPIFIRPKKDGTSRMILMNMLNTVILKWTL
jgi:hypothetical protein